MVLIYSVSSPDGWNIYEKRSKAQFQVKWFKRAQTRNMALYGTLQRLLNLHFHFKIVIIINAYILYKVLISNRRMN